jgi:hypothetical protein
MIQMFDLLASISLILYSLAFLYSIDSNLTLIEKSMISPWLVSMCMNMVRLAYDVRLETKYIQDQWMQMKQHTKHLEARRIARKTPQIVSIIKKKKLHKIK